MNVKADAFLDYDQAVVIDKLISGLPEIVRAFAAPRLCFNVRQTDKVGCTAKERYGTAGASGNVDPDRPQ